VDRKAVEVVDETSYETCSYDFTLESVKYVFLMVSMTHLLTAVRAGG
jgi:hypothetical protein